MKNIKEFKTLFNFVKEYKTKLIIASIMIFISGICDIFTGYLNGGAVTEITKGALIYLGIYFAIEIIVGGILIHVSNSILYKIESAITRKLGYYTYVKALNLPAVAYEELSSGEVINRINNDADSLSFTFGRLLGMISSLVASLITIVYVFANSWIVGIEILIFLLLLLLILKKYNPLLKNIHKERKNEQDKFTSLTTESIRGIREIKTLGIKNNLISDMADIIKIIYKKSETEIDIQKRFNILTRLLKTCLEVGTFVTCVILVYYNKVSLTFFIAMTYYIYRYMWLIENINDLTQNYQKFSVSISRVNDILENKLYEEYLFSPIALRLLSIKDKSNAMLNVIKEYESERSKSFMLTTLEESSEKASKNFYDLSAIIIYLTGETLAIQIYYYYKLGLITIEDLQELIRLINNNEHLESLNLIFKSIPATEDIRESIIYIRNELLKKCEKTIKLQK